MRTSFILHIDSLSVLDKMTDEQAGKLFKALHSYQKTKELPEDDLLIQVAITPFINQFSRDEKMYEERAERSRENGKHGGRPLKIRKKNPKNPVGYLETQNNPEEPRKPDSVSKSDSVSDKEIQTAYIKFQDWQKKNASNVLKMQEPFTIDQYSEIITKYKPQELKDLLISMHNYKPLLTKNVSAYLTLLNWAKRRDETNLAPVKNLHEKETFHPALKNRI